MRKRITIMAGGTGGHVFPALAVANELIKDGWHVRWLGTSDRMEAHIIPKHHIEIDFVRISGLRGKGFLTKLYAPIKIFLAILSARRIIKKYRPDVVLGMGGYVSGPGGIAAKLCGVPLILHEQNSVAGLTNKTLALFANQVLEAYPNVIKNAELVGNPVRDEILTLPDPKTRFAQKKGPIKILVMGGSQGAKVINETMPQVLSKLTVPCLIWHQTGKNNLQQVTDDYQKLGQIDENKPPIITEFITNMAEAYQWADVVICRSGALTVSELQAVGLGAIFIPFMHKDKQQYYNALPMQQEGAAYIVEQLDLTAEKLAQIINTFDQDALLQMAEKSHQMAIRTAAKQVANVIKKSVKHKKI